MKTIDVTIETPKGSTEKYSYDPELNAYKLKKILPAGMIFPYDFGFLPGTKGADGDPLDILVLSEYKSFPGCIMECRVIGAMVAEQSAGKEMERNDRYICIPVLSKVYQDIKSIKDLPDHILPELEHFFINYNSAQGKQFKVLKSIDAKAAYKQLMKGKDEEEE